MIVEVAGPCFFFGPEPVRTTHGTLERIDSFTARYTPDPGFVGVDSFDYSCVTSAVLQGTVTITVTPAQAPPAEPVPEAPTFTG